MFTVKYRKDEIQTDTYEGAIEAAQLVVKEHNPIFPVQILQNGEKVVEIENQGGIGILVHSWSDWE